MEQRVCAVVCGIVCGLVFPLGGGAVVPGALLCGRALVQGLRQTPEGGAVQRYVKAACRCVCGGDDGIGGIGGGGGTEGGGCMRHLSLRQIPA